MDRFEQLSLFVAVADSGSFSAAARLRRITPSAASKQIAALEERLGVRLINRTTRRLALTDEGRAFYERARQLVTELAEAEEAVRDLRGRPRGRLTIEAPVIFGRRWLVPLVQRFLIENPEIVIDLRLNDRIVDLVAEGVDLVIRTGEMRDSSLIGRRLSTNRRVVVASPAYLDRKGRPESPADLAKHDCIIHSVRAERYLWRFYDDKGLEAAAQRVSGRIEVNDVDAIRTSALSGLGIAQVPIWLVAEELESGKLERVLPQLHAPEGEIFALYPHSRHLSAKVRAFLDFLVAHFASREDWWNAPAP